jgi:CubicO group peptidase (beta-lactamase class C family)
MKWISLGIACLLLLIPWTGVSAQDSTYEGTWYSETEGIVLQFEGTALSILEVAADQCNPVMDLEVDGDTVLSDGEVAFTLALENDTLTVLQGGAVALTAVRVDSFEALCPSIAAPITVNVKTLQTWDDVDTLIQSVFDQTSIPGMAVAIVTPDGVVWSQGYGYANVEAQQPATPDTPFTLASITKTVTATALLQAWQDGLIDLDAPINDVLPFVVDNPHVEGETITARHLATHTSGIIDNYPVYMASYVPGDSPIALGDFLQGYLVEGGEWYDADANYAARMPGTEMEYCNVAAALAGYLVEVVTGKPLDVFAQERIFDPLGMTNTYWHLSSFDDISILATPYNTDGTPIEQYGYPTWPDGGLRSSVNDMGRFLAAVMNGGELDGVHILDEATVEMMLQPQFPDVAPDQGFIWGLNELDMGMIGHTGGDPGVTTVMFYDPTQKFGMLIFTNSDSTSVVSALTAFIEPVVTNASNLLAQ